jgi:predicted NBD/HSP70 family sugar kinase
MTETNEILVVGVDIGGTKVAAGLVDRNGEIKSQIRTPMVANRGAGDSRRWFPQLIFFFPTIRKREL